MPQSAGEPLSHVEGEEGTISKKTTLAWIDVSATTASESIESDQAALDAEMWREMFLDDAQALGVDLSAHIGDEFDFDAAYELTGRLVRRLGDSLDSTVTFGSKERGEEVVCRIIERNFATLLAASPEERNAWLEQACYSLSSLRFAEAFTDDKRVLQALSNGTEGTTCQELLEMISIPSGEQIAAAVSRLVKYNESLGNAVSHLWTELLQIGADKAAQIQFVKGALGEAMFSGLLPSRIAEILSKKASISEVDSAQAAETTTIIRDGIDAKLDNVAAQYSQSGIPELAGLDAALYSHLAYAIAYGWGRFVQQAGRGTNLKAFKENLGRGERGLSPVEVENLLKIGRANNFFVVDHHRGHQSVVLDREACSDQLESFIYEIQELRRSGGATGAAGSTPARRANLNSPVRKTGLRTYR